MVTCNLNQINEFHYRYENISLDKLKSTTLMHFLLEIQRNYLSLGFCQFNRIFLVFVKVGFLKLERENGWNKWVHVFYLSLGRIL